MDIDYDGLVKLYNENRLYKEVKENLSKTKFKDGKKTGVNEFIKIYE